MQLSDRIFHYLAACPPAISNQNGHTQTFIVACALVQGFALSESEALEYLRRYNDRCQPPWEEKDLLYKIQQAGAAQHKKVKGYLLGENGTFSKDDFKLHSVPAKQQEPKPVIDPATAIENFLQGFRCSECDLAEASPIRPSEDWTQDGWLLVDQLFLPGECVNFVTAFQLKANRLGEMKPVPNGYGETEDKETLVSRWRTKGMPHSDAGGWMRMNPIEDGISDACVRAFRHILLEFDSVTIDLQLALLCKLPLPISAILTSGGRSLHAWVKADCQDLKSYKETSARLLDSLKMFGLDHKNKNPSRLSRLVGVTRTLGASDDGRQRLLYLSPNPEQKAIL